MSLDAQLDLIAGGSGSAGFFEIIAGSETAYVPISDRAAAHRLVTRLAQTADVYIGLSCDGASCWVIRVDCDDDLALERARRIEPTLIASSGRGGLHAYFAMDEPLSLPEADALTARLALLCGGDHPEPPGNRQTRPLGTLDHKYDPPRPIEVVEFDPGRTFSPRELRAATRGARLRPRTPDRTWLTAPLPVATRVALRTEP